MADKRGLCAVALVATILTIGVQSLAQASQAPAHTDAKPSHVFDVRDFGAAADGKTHDTQAISKAIKAANAAGGGRVIFPPGVYRTGTFDLLSNVTLDVQAGAVIQGSKDLADYGATADYGFGTTYGVDSTGEGRKVGIIVARNAENVAIVGQGAIDGSGNDFFGSKPHYGMDFDPQYTRQGPDFMKSMLETGDGPVEAKPAGRPGTMIVFSHCQNILIRDITLRNAPNWTLHLFHSQRAVVTGIHIVNSLLLPNNDGIDCIDCTDAHFSDSDIRAGDDDFAFWDGEGITVTNCSLVSHSAGIRLENTRDSVFSNLSIHANRGIGIFEREGTTANLVFSGITIDTQLLTGHWWGKAEPIFIAVGPPRGNAKPGEVRDVRFSNIIGEAEGGIVMYGDAASRVHNIFLNHIKFKIRAPRTKVSELAGGNFDFRWTATSLANAVFKHDIPGMYCRYLEGLHVHDFTLQWGTGLPEYFSNAMECEDFAQLEIDGFQGRQASESAANPAIVLRRGTGISIRDSKADSGTSSFLSTANVRGAGLFVNNDLSRAKRAFENGNPGFRLFGNIVPAEGQSRKKQ